MIAKLTAAREAELPKIAQYWIAPLTHEEHKPIQLEPGLYEIGRVNEYDYLSEMVRKVVD